MVYIIAAITVCIFISKNFFKYMNIEDVVNDPIFFSVTIAISGNTSNVCGHFIYVLIKQIAFI